MYVIYTLRGQTKPVTSHLHSDVVIKIFILINLHILKDNTHNQKQN